MKYYVNTAPFKTTKKEQAMLSNQKASVEKNSNDALDALWYTSSTLADTTTAGGYAGATSTTTTGAYTGYYQKDILGRRDETEEKLEAAQKENAELRDELSFARRSKEIFVKVLTNLHVKMQELDLSDIRVSDPFNYRVQRNALDKLMNDILRIMDNSENRCADPILGFRSSERMIAYFEEKGLL